MKDIIKAILLLLLTGIINSLLWEASNSLLMYFISFIILLLEFILLLKLYKRTSSSEEHNYTIKDLLIMALISAFIFIVFKTSELGLINYLFPDYKNNHIYNEPIEIINVILLVPIFEELVFRGIFINVLKQKHAFVLVNLFQSIIFAFLHLDLVVGFFALIIGLILGYIVKCFNIYYCMFIHSLNNFYSLFVNYEINLSKQLFLFIGTTSCLILSITLKKLSSHYNKYNITDKSQVGDDGVS